MEGLYKEFGAHLRVKRKEAKLTQEQVAVRVGLTRTSITNIELGRQHIALHQVYLLASAVGATPAELLPDHKGALEELLPDSALLALAHDDEGREFAARVLRQTPNRTREEAA